MHGRRDVALTERTATVLDSRQEVQKQQAYIITNQLTTFFFFIPLKIKEPPMVPRERENCGSLSTKLKPKESMHQDFELSKIPSDI